jgi:uncharacterized protein (DUF342 family)
MAEQIKSKNMPVAVDAIVKILLSTDQMEAKILIEPPKNDGRAASALSIDNAIRAAKVNFGIDMQLLQRIKAEPQYSKEFILARGVAPVNGVDGSIKYNFAVKVDAHPKVREDGTVDYRDLGIVCNVRKGQILAEITLPTRGSEGMTVTGRKIVPVSGKLLGSPVGRNTELSPDGTKLSSKVDGHVGMMGTRVNVVDTFIVTKDVDNSTGSINSVCNVSVCSSVLEGFMVEAQGNVDIGNAIEGGSVKAAGNVTVHGGVVGRSRSKIECRGNFKSTFLENCEANAGGSIDAESIMNSNVKCGGKLELSGMRAKLMGGRCVVGQDLIANSIGSPANLRTELVLGADPAIVTRYGTLAAEIKQLKESLEKLGQIVVLLSKYEQAGTLPASKKRMLMSTQSSIQTSELKLNNDIDEYNSLSGQIENSGRGKVICRGMMYRGVKLTIGFASIELENDIASSSFALVDGKIVITPVSPY